MRAAFVARLQHIHDVLRASELFHCMEAVGSSLLFVYDQDPAYTVQPGIWLIDFAKTHLLSGAPP